MYESMMERRRVCDEGFMSRKALSEGKNKRIIISVRSDVPSEEAPANSVPAAAVIRREQALSGIIGRKGHVGGSVSRM